MTLLETILSDLSPSNLGHYGVAADLLEDEGDAVGSEALRWLLEKKRYPYGGLTWANYLLEYQMNDADLLPTWFGNYFDPQRLHVFTDGDWLTGKPRTKCEPINLFVNAWRALSPDKREEAWSWSPSDHSPKRI